LHSPCQHPWSGADGITTPPAAVGRGRTIGRVVLVPHSRIRCWERRRHTHVERLSSLSRGHEAKSRSGLCGPNNNRFRLDSNLLSRSRLKTVVSTEYNWNGLFPSGLQWVLQQLGVRTKRAQKLITNMRNLLLDGATAIWRFRCREANDGEIPDTEFTATLRDRATELWHNIENGMPLHLSDAIPGRSRAIRSMSSYPINCENMFVNLNGCCARNAHADSDSPTNTTAPWA
jgi:hypothetical protein